MKNFRKHINEFAQARHRYEVRLAQEKRMQEKRLAHSGESQKETRSSLFKVHPKA